MATLFSSRLPLLTVVCPDCDRTHSLRPNQIGYKIAVDHAKETASCARISCGCAQTQLSARAQLTGMGSEPKLVVKRGRYIKRVVRLVTA